ncbi:MAG TPA: polyhydroxyalkanoate depolymerase [Caulobacteraceae bacterium]|nr:polyhydroxyalkanoate depolymerase [Caulobacteraceae bacterium]
MQFKTPQQLMYQGYQTFSDLLAPLRAAAEGAIKLRDMMDVCELPVVNHLLAWLSVSAGAKITHKRPDFGIDKVMVGNREHAVRETVALSLPFANLIHFAKDDLQAAQPKMLVVAPLSGHFATLLRATVRTLLQDHDVYITDWANARDVPLDAGRFGFDEYVDYVIRFLEHVGPDAHVLAVCQPCVQTLAAVAIMAEDKHPCQPRSMTLMGGPVFTRIAPTGVNELAQSKPMSWFEQNLISSVPFMHPGAGRRVYPGFVQLTAFMSMNPDRHIGQHRRLQALLAAGQYDEAAVIQDFYKEYFAVLDLTAEFFLETVDRIFQRDLLGLGQLEHRGRRVRPDLIHRTALLTVEGERDDICAVGQTAAAHDLCSSLRPHLKRHHLQPGVGHYGLFSGRKWENQIYPQVRNLVLVTS